MCSWCVNRQKKKWREIYTCLSCIQQLYWSVGKLCCQIKVNVVNNSLANECRAKWSAVGNIFWHIMQFSWGKGHSHQQLTPPHGVAVQLTASGSRRDAGRKSEQSVISLLSPQDTTAVLAHGQSGRQIGAAEATSFLPEGPRGGEVEWKLQEKDGTEVEISFPSCL